MSHVAQHFRDAFEFARAHAFRAHGQETVSFRAECPALLLLREAPGHEVEESLFDVSCGNTSIPKGIPRRPARTRCPISRILRGWGSTANQIRPAAFLSHQAEQFISVTPPYYSRDC